MEQGPHKKQLLHNIRIHHSTTRSAIIDAARQLFARFGVEKTTMNDIAQQSNKGRRTLYMYFKSKKDLFAAVVSHELDLLSERLDIVVSGKEPPYDRFINLIYTHLETILQIVMRNGTLRADFFNDIAQLERIRYRFDCKEAEFIKQILNEGNESGVFCVRDTEMASTILQHSIKGLEVPYINKHSRKVGSKEFDRMRLATEQLLFRGLGYNGKVSHNIKTNEP